MGGWPAGSSPSFPTKPGKTWLLWIFSCGHSGPPFHFSLVFMQRYFRNLSWHLNVGRATSLLTSAIFTVIQSSARTFKTSRHHCWATECQPTTNSRVYLKTFHPSSLEGRRVESSLFRGTKPSGATLMISDAVVPSGATLMKRPSWKLFYFQCSVTRRWWCHNFWC